MPIQTATFTAQMKIRQGKRRREQETGWEVKKKKKGEKTEKGKRGNGRKEQEMDYAQQRESKER